MTRIMTLNMWGYYDWDARKDNLLELVSEESPDCIALQEVQLNHAFSHRPASDYIADGCAYRYRIFAPTYPRNDQIDRLGERTQRTSYGLAFISKHPIITAETHFLRLYPDHDEESSVLFCTVDVDGTLMDFCTVHFANSDKHSELHLSELMEICQQFHRRPIILGDFNNFHLGAYKDTLLHGYGLTTDAASYTSMPKDNGTLDYIAAPTDRYEISDVACPDGYVSDHRAVLATVMQKVVA